MTGAYRIRAMTVQDIPAGMRLKELAGWNQVEEDWRLLLELSPQRCFVTVCDGQVVGAVSTIGYESRISWIGMLLVDPAHRRQGIGAGLLQRALASLRDSDVVRLDATPAGETLYARHGFRREWRLVRMAIDRLPSVSGPPPDVCPVTPETLGAVAALDRAAFGAARGLLLRALVMRSPDLAWQRMRQGQLVGLCLGRRGSQFVQLGPLVAECADDAALLCRAALHNLAGRAVALDVPEGQAAFLSWLQNLGFVAQRPFVRMAWRGRSRLEVLDPNALCPGRPMTDDRRPSGALGCGALCPDTLGRPTTDDRRPAEALGSGPPNVGAAELLFAIAGPEFG